MIITYKLMYMPGVGSSQASVQARRWFKPGVGSGQALDRCTRIRTLPSLFLKNVTIFHLFLEKYFVCKT